VSRAGRLALLAACVVAALLFSLCVGAAGLALSDVVRALAGKGDAAARTIVLDLRLPRALLALLVGGGLGLAGAVFQALLRNPLADPYILGVSGGAAAGAVAALALGLTLTTPYALPLAALAGAALAVAVVFRVAMAAARSLDTRVLLLAGVVVAAFFNAVILLVLSLARLETFRSAIFWMLGSLSGASWPAVATLAAYALPATLILLALARPLNLLAVGEESALYLGMPVEVVKRVVYFVASFLVAACVAVSGAIGFVGLIVPHALRLLWGSDHRLVLPGSVLLGGGFLLLADTAARTIVAPQELPVGVLTALVGVPVFVLLLVRRSL
jgi:ABC-type Fe3+-siderophore transport system permease subunit